jgi:ribosome-binding protein aMBF1 (putative translation factor)
MKYRLVRESGKFFGRFFIALSFPIVLRNRNVVTMHRRRRHVNTNRNCVMILRPIQCRMARAALGLGVRELAAVAKVSVDTVARFERGEELKERTIDALQRALEGAGIKLIDENGGGPGVRLRKRQQKKG